MGLRHGPACVLAAALAAACSDDPGARSGSPANRGGSTAAASGRGGRAGDGSTRGGAAGSRAGDGAGARADAGRGAAATAGAAGVGGSGGEPDGGTSGSASPGGASGDGTGALGGGPGAGGTDGGLGGVGGAGATAGNDVGGESGTAGDGGGTAGNGGTGEVVDCTVFVAPDGHPDGAGTKLDPVGSLADGVELAAAQSSAGTVCACTNDALAEWYSDNVTLPEGVSLVGSYSCSDWVRDSTAQRTWFNGTVAFEAGASRATRFGSFALSSVVSISEAEPTVFDVHTTGLYVSGSHDGPRRKPLVKDSWVHSDDTGGGVGVSNAAPELVNLDIVGYTNASSGTAYVVGFGAGGNVDGLILRGGAIWVWPSSSVYTVSYGASFDYCEGNVLVDGVDVTGGTDFGASDGPWTGIRVAGPSCKVHIVGSETSTIRGCAEGRICTGVECNQTCVIERAHIVGASVATANAQVDGLNCIGCTSVTDSTITGCDATKDFVTYGTCVGVDVNNYVADPLPEFTNNTIKGAGVLTTSSSSTYAEGVRLGPAIFRGNTIRAADELPSNGAAVSAIGTIWSNPAVFDGNVLEAGGCDGYASIRVIDVYRANPIFTNNLITDRPSDPGCTGSYGVTLASLYSASADGGGPTFVNNTFTFTRTADHYRSGIVFNTIAEGGPQAKFVNNVFANLATSAAGFGETVREYSTVAEPLVFHHNLVHDVGNGTTSGSLVYVDEGNDAAPLTTIAALNALYGGSSAANLSADPGLGTTLHLESGSVCIDAGTPSGAPDHDIDGDARPLGNAIDIGADERG